MNIADFQAIIRERLAARGTTQHRAAREGDLPQDAIRNVLAGHTPRLDRAVEICDALGLELYIGPSREPSDLYGKTRDTEGRSLAPLQTGALEHATQELVRLTVGLGGDPIPDDLRSSLLPESEELTAHVGADIIEFPGGRSGGEVSPDRYGFVKRYTDDVRLAAGAGTPVEHEIVAGVVAFRVDWLRTHRLRAHDLSLVDVQGESMEPTLYAGDVALVDHSRREPRSGRIFALRTADGPLIKRLRRRGGHLWAESDHPDHAPRQLDGADSIVGRVVWWAHTERLR